MNTTLLGMNLISQAYEMDDYLKIPLNEGQLTVPVYSETTTPTLTPALDSAFKLNGQPDYFLVKTGNNGTTPDYRWFLFDNKINLDYAVFLLQDTTEGYSIRNITGLSHGAQVGGTPVPEPATMLLFGTGLAGLAAVARRRKN